MPDKLLRATRSGDIMMKGAIVHWDGHSFVDLFLYVEHTLATAFEMAHDPELALICFEVVQAVNSRNLRPGRGVFDLLALVSRYP
jgi:hypothetical protein